MKQRKVSSQYFIDRAGSLALNAGCTFPVDTIIDAEALQPGYAPCSDAEHITILQSMNAILAGNWHARETRNAVLQNKLNELLAQELI